MRIPCGCQCRLHTPNFDPPKRRSFHPIIHRQKGQRQVTRTLILITCLLGASICAQANASEPLPANTIAPGLTVSAAIRAVVAAQAKMHSWQVSCGPVYHSYECLLFTPGGNVNTTVNGELVTVTVHAYYRVAHAGCVYTVAFSSSNAIAPVTVDRGCGSAGLRRIRGALVLHAS